MNFRSGTTYTLTTSFRGSGGGGSSPTYAPAPVAPWVYEVPTISDAEAYDIRERMEFDARVQASVSAAAEAAEREADEKAEARAAARKKEIADEEGRSGWGSDEAAAIRRQHDQEDSSACAVM